MARAWSSGPGVNGSFRGSDAHSLYQDGEERFSPARLEFLPVGITETRIQGTRLGPRSARALAELLRMLSCGEESAALAFDRLGGSWHEPAVRSALAGIAADERRHQAMLATLEASLPRPQHDPPLAAAIRSFFRRLADRDVLVHCARVVAIDSAVCQILGALRGRRKPLAADVRVGAILGRIHHDEARHVAIASDCAAPLLKSVRGREIAVDARERLTRVLRLRADSLEALAVDPDRLFARLRTNPPWRAIRSDAC